MVPTRIHDISFPISDRMVGFPGDPPVRVERVRSIERGAPYNLSALALGSHTGTHVDPPLHFVPGGASIDEVPIEALNGPCEVVAIPREVSRIDRTLAAQVPAGAERVLFRTSNSERWRAGGTFFDDFVALDPGAAEALVEAGVRLVGIDAFSIERDPTGGFPVHHRLLGSGVLILEGILLGSVPAGRYELRCLPLRIAQGDGGPCRALLVAP